MAVESRPRTPALERSWWLRAPAVLVAPRAVFVSLRDESDEAVEARQEPLVAFAGLAGIARVLGTPVARQLLRRSLVLRVADSGLGVPRRHAVRGRRLLALAVGSSTAPPAVSADSAATGGLGA